jgi:hypothetical protein
VRVRVRVGVGVGVGYTGDAEGVDEVGDELAALGHGTWLGIGMGLGVRG